MYRSEGGVLIAKMSLLSLEPAKYYPQIINKSDPCLYFTFRSSVELMVKMVLINQ